MQTTEVDYLDGEIQVNEQEPSTIAELIDMIGEEAVVENVNSNLRYRNKYPRVYAKASAQLEATIPREVKETKTMKDGTQKQVKVSANDHLREAHKQNAAKTAEVIATVAQSEPLYVKGERTGGGGKISQGALDAANNFFAAGDEKVEKVIDAIEGQVPGYKIGRDADGAATPESLARGIQALNRHAQKLAEKAALSALAGA